MLVGCSRYQSRSTAPLILAAYTKQIWVFKGKQINHVFCNFPCNFPANFSGASIFLIAATLNRVQVAKGLFVLTEVRALRMIVSFRQSRTL